MEAARKVFRNNTWKYVIALSLLLITPNRITTTAVAATPQREYSKLEFSAERTVSSEWLAARELFELYDARYKSLSYIEEQAQRYQVPTTIAFALIYTESSFLSRARHINSNGTIDEGIAQLNNSNLEYFSWKFNEGKAYNPYDIFDAVPISMKYLRSLYLQFGNWRDAVAAYNCGPYRVTKRTIPLSTRYYVQKIVSLHYTMLGQHRRSGNARD